MIKLYVALFIFISVLNMVTADSNTMPLPIWNHPTSAAPTTAPAPQATACAGSGQIAVTYNEGPSDVTAKVLNGLKAAQAKANFFVNASWLYTQQYAMILQRAYNDGHLIGMTYRAPGDSSEGLTDDQIKQDVTNTAKIVETLIGVAPKYVRLHYSTPEDYRLEHIIRSMGYTLVAYNLDIQDYNFKNNPKGIADLYRSTFSKQLDTYDSKGSFISVQYDIPDTGSWQGIYDTVNVINEAGYTMVRLDGCLLDKAPYKESAISEKAVGDKHSFGTGGYKEGQVAVEAPASVANATSIDTSDIQLINRNQKKSGAHSLLLSRLPAMISVFSPVIGFFLWII